MKAREGGQEETEDGGKPEGRSRNYVWDRGGA